MTKPNEPTLTCSEVVERLAKCVELRPDFANGRQVAVLDSAKATAILHSWRERRVQELEEALREIADTLSAGQGYVGVAERCREYAETALLAKSGQVSKETLK